MGEAARSVPETCRRHANSSRTPAQPIRMDMRRPILMDGEVALESAEGHPNGYVTRGKTFSPIAPGVGTAVIAQFHPHATSLANAFIENYPY